MRKDWREHILEQWCSYFPCMSGPGLPNHQMFTTNPAAFSLSPPLLSPCRSFLDFFFLSLSLWGPLKQALPVITHTQFTRGLWSKWNVSSHMMVCALYSYSTEKAERRKRETRFLDCCQLFLWFSRCLLCPSSSLICTRLHLCVYLWACVVSTRACVCICLVNGSLRHQVTDDNGRLAAERTGMEHDGVCMPLYVCACVCARGTSSHRCEDGI